MVIKAIVAHLNLILFCKLCDILISIFGKISQKAKESRNQRTSSKGVKLRESQEADSVFRTKCTRIRGETVDKGDRGIAGNSYGFSYGLGWRNDYPKVLDKEQYLKKYYREIESTNSFKIYVPRFKEIFDDRWNQVRKVEVGNKSLSAPEKVIMVLGATGSGKTTLINAMANYIFGIELEDNFRLKLIDETDMEKDEAESRTEYITAYTIHRPHFSKVDYTLTIIDTPGYGDTHGIERDQKVISQIKEFFESKEGVDTLHAVGFVAQSSLPRLTPTQRYIFDSILSLFGKDIAENIFLLLTFADGQPAQVLSAIKAAQVPYKDSFKFNNSVLYVDSKDMFSEMFWKMGITSLEIFMTELGKVTARSLTLSTHVLRERSQLEVTIENLQLEITQEGTMKQP